MKLWQKNLILVLLVAVIVALPLWLCRDAEFGGADGMAEELIQETNPDYEPWFSPVFEPASGEIESLLFALQAAAGSGVVFFILGRMTARKPDPKEDGK